MSDSLKKVLTGAVIGALLVGFLWHASLRRGGPAPAAPSAGGGSARPAVAVVTAPVRAERLAFELEALGTARANESVDVTAKVSNLVTAVKFAEGQQVQQGAVLVELDGAQARADLAIAEAALAESRSQYARSRELYTTRALSEAQLEQIEATLKANEARVVAARSRLGDTVIRAPFAGRVGLRRVSVGSLVNPGTVITTLDDTRTIKLDFTIPETFLAEVSPGLAITAHSVAYPDRSFTGEVASIDSRVDPSTRSVTVRALVPNPERILKPGMFLTVRLVRGERDALVIPEEAVVPEQGDVFVFVIEDGVAEKRLVKTGQRRVGSVQVTDGLAAGEVVVIEGTQKLRNGAEVRVVGEAPAPESASTAAGAGT
jgi:membrane fusion protein (multidrug efflux system)